MNEDRRQELLTVIGDINDFDPPRPLVPLDLYFEGNDDPGSIGYNLDAECGPEQFYALLRAIRDRAEVADVLIEVKDLEDEDGWPSSDTIWLFVAEGVPADTVQGWFPAELAPDEFNDNWSDDVSGRPQHPGTRALSAFYD